MASQLLQYKAGLPCWAILAQRPIQLASWHAASLFLSPSPRGFSQVLCSLLPFCLSSFCSAHFEGSLLSSSLKNILLFEGDCESSLLQELPRLILGRTNHLFPELLLGLLSHNLNFSLY